MSSRLVSYQPASVGVDFGKASMVVSIDFMSRPMDSTGHTGPSGKGLGSIFDSTVVTARSASEAQKMELMSFSSWTVV